MDMRTQSIFKSLQPVTQKAMDVQMAAGAAMGGMPMPHGPGKPFQAEPAQAQTTLRGASELVAKLGLGDIVKFPFPSVRALAGAATYAQPAHAWVRICASLGWRIPVDAA